MLTIFFTAVGLAMDAFAVSVTSGITIKRPTILNAITIATAFGIFQAGMPVIGWAGGQLFSQAVEGIDHWLAFALLTLIGGHMIYEAIRGDDGEKKSANPLNFFVLIMLAVATSIDALVVGVSFAFLRIPIVQAAVVIGLVTFGISSCGVFAGNRLGQILGHKAEILGGLVLIGIGGRILLEGLAII